MLGEIISASGPFFGGICHCLMGLKPEEFASCGRGLGYVVDYVCVG